MLLPLIQNNLEGFTSQAEKLTCYEAISKGSQISFLKANSEAFVKSAIHLLVEDVLKHYESLGKVSDGFTPRLVQVVLGKYWWMKLEEIAYVFNKGKNGEYGRSNKNISSDTILDWLKQYELNERDEEMIAYNRKLQEETNKNRILSDEQLKGFYKNAEGIDKTESIPDGSNRISDTKETDSEYRKEKMRILNEIKENREKELSKENQAQKLFTKLNESNPNKSV